MIPLPGSFSRLLALTALGVFAVGWEASATVVRHKNSKFAPAERFVLRNVSAGEVADLKKRFPNRRDRVLRAHFLEKLLTGELKGAMIRRQGVRIQHAVIKEELDLSSANLPYRTWLDECDFEQDVTLANSQLASNVSFEGSTFAKGAEFNGTKARMSLFLNRAVFRGSVDLGYAEIGRNLEADGARFLNEKGRADFRSLRVGEYALFRNAVFKGTVVSFVGADCESLLLGRFPNRDAETKTTESEELHVVKEVNLWAAKIRRQLEIQGLKLDELNAASLRVLGMATLAKTNIGKHVDLENAHFDDLKLAKVTWPPDQASRRLEGITFQRISAGEAEGDEGAWRELVAWIDGASFSTQPYSQLEAAFRTAGHLDRADQVFERMREREGAHAGSMTRCKNFLLHWLVRYGRSPERAFGWSALVWILGIWVFRKPQNMVPQKPDLPTRPYSSIWYSLDLLTPLIDLQEAGIWGPRRDWRFGRTYSKFHRLLGWILIPIGLAALTGIIK